MLYDGLFNFAECAQPEIALVENPNGRPQAAHSVARCIDIMTELSTSLKHSVDPVLCGTLTDLYRFFAREFSEALDQCEPARIQAILPLIQQLRNAWFEADRKANRFHPVAA
jgi:flagellar biosynthetic protein FliS